ncbi:MAG: type IV secretion system protein [Azoarcus sp.]|jgi:hypothetical protein|nr:type IV secretion system protein [Azoarcus sp.]
MKSVYNQTSARLQNIGNLMAKINQAKDPGDKEDLANRIAIEQATLAANIQAMEAYQKISQDEIRHAALEAKKEWACAQFNTQDTCF